MATILIVDDNPQNREYLITLLGYKGHHLLEAADGEAGLALAREKRPDLIITDIIMPAMDGYEFARQVRADPEIGRTAVIFYTASYIASETKQLAAACGVSHLLTKPVEPETVFETVEAALTFEQPPITPPPSETFHREHLRLLTDTLAKKVEELESEIVERERAEAALREAEVRYRTLVEQLPAVTYLDRVHARIEAGEYKIVYLSPQVETLLGYRQEEFLAQPTLWANLMHAEDRKKVLAQNAQHYTTHQPYQAEYRMITKDGLVVWVRDEAVIVADAQSDDLCSQGVVMNITARKQRERELEAIATLSAALRSATRRDEIYPVILEKLSALFVADGAALVLPVPASDELVVEMAVGILAPFQNSHLSRTESISGEVITTGKTYQNNEAHTEPGLELAQTHPKIHAVACTPLIAQGQSIGALWISRINEITGEDVRVLIALADLTASAIQRANLYEKTQKQLEKLFALRAIDQAITNSLDTRLTLRILLDQVIAQLQIDAADILLLNPQSYRLEYAAGRGFRTRSVEKTYLQLGNGYAGRAALERRTIRIPNIAEAPPDFMHVSLYPEEGFRAYYGVPLMAKGMFQGVLEVYHRSPLTADPDWEDFLETLAGQTAIAIENAQLFTKLQDTNMQLMMAYDATIEGWSRALDLRDKETEGHTQRVTDMTMKLAVAIGGFTEAELVHIRRGALLHDIGKMGIPDAILLKPGPLTDEEWVTMRKHPTYARELLMPIAYLRPALDIPYAHHEKWNGTGYPQGLRETQIPLPARLFAVVDVWDAVTSDRPYRPAWTKARALEYIRDQAGGHFDPQVVEAFMQLVSES